jgi:hypothetical protein
MISDTAHVVRLKNGGLRRKMAVDLLHERHNVLLLLARGVDVTEEYDLRVSAGQDEDAASVVVLRVCFLLLFICRIP